MVNTFLISSDYLLSARSLDTRRLGKQRCEAYQILNIIEDLHFLSKELSLPRSDNLHSWIRLIVRHYKSLSYRFIFQHSSYQKVSISSSHDIKILQQRGKREGFRVVTLGFVYHPIVKMWMDYKESLKMYINAHIQAWVERGYHNTMTTYSLSENPPQPPWSYDSKIHQNHISSLLWKEIERKESPWYQHMFSSYNIKPFTGYIWVI